MCIVCMNIVLISNVSGFVEMLATESITNYPFEDNKVYFISYFKWNKVKTKNWRMRIWHKKVTPPVSLAPN